MISDGFRPMLLAWLAAVTASCGIDGSSRKIQVTKDEVLSNLIDPRSAEFKELKLIAAPGIEGIDMIVCGSVNAKNRMGGYVGFTRFAGLFETDSEKPNILMENDLETRLKLKASLESLKGFGINVGDKEKKYEQIGTQAGEIVDVCSMHW